MKLRCDRCKKWAKALCAVIPAAGYPIEEICVTCFKIAEYDFALGERKIPREWRASVIANKTGRFEIR